MGIKTRLRINSAIAFVLMLVMVFFFVQFRQQADHSDRNLALVEEMRRVAFERTELRDEYLANQSERAKFLWEKKTERFRLLVEEAKESLVKTTDNRTIEEIEAAFKATIPIFYKLSEIGERENHSYHDPALISERQKRLMNQILLKVHVQMDQINALRESVKRTYDSAHDNLHLLFMVCVGAFVLVTIGNSIILNNLLAKRVGALRRGTEIIGEGNLDYRIDVPGNDELSELARKSNDMAAKLKDSHTSVDNLQREITGRMKAEEELQSLNRELEQRVRGRTAQLDASNKELESFAYSVSHDLRAPLRGIDGWSLALLEDYGDRLDEQAHGYLRRVRAETQQMGRLIDDLLKLSRVTRVEMQSMPVDLAAIALKIAGNLQEERPERQIEFIIQPEMKADCDGPLLEIALANLLDNAVKFTGKRAAARIEFGETEADGGKALFVRDNGVGFDMAYAHKLFGAFQRLHKSSEFPGTGIGLATVQRIIHRHGGRIWAEAKPDQGAVFYFTLKEAV